MLQHPNFNMKTMKYIIPIFFLLCANHIQSQPFNRVYRLYKDSANPRGTASQFFAMRVLNNKIIVGGGSIVKEDSFYNTNGNLTFFDLKGEIIKNQFFGKNNITNSINGDAIVLNYNEISLMTYNNDFTVSKLKFDTSGTLLSNIRYYNKNAKNSDGFGTPKSLIKTKYGYIANYKERVDSLRFTGVMLMDTGISGTLIKKISFPFSQYSNYVSKVIENKDSNLTILVSHTNRAYDSEADFVTSSEIIEFDTTGNILWRYSTSDKRYIFLNGFQQLANGNYLIWGDEEFSYLDPPNPNRLITGVKPYFALINKKTGLVWERYLERLARFNAIKILKDSSIIFAGYIDSSYAFIYKLNKNFDTIFFRKFKPPQVFSKGNLNIINQIDQFNSDLILCGHNLDYKIASPTYGEWGWLVRTDSMGCSLEPDSCMRVAVEDVPVDYGNFNLYPNPVSDVLNIQFKEAAKGVVYITDLSGKALIQKSIENVMDYSMDVASLTAGMYIITYVDAQGRKSVRKFVKVE
jgi:Secretion system C-terminal sorting domain